MNNNVNVFTVASLITKYGNEISPMAILFIGFFDDKRTASASFK